MTAFVAVDVNDRCIVLDINENFEDVEAVARKAAVQHKLGPLKTLYRDVQIVRIDTTLFTSGGADELISEPVVFHRLQYPSRPGPDLIIP